MKKCMNGKKGMVQPSRLHGSRSNTFSTVCLWDNAYITFVHHLSHMVRVVLSTAGKAVVEMLLSEGGPISYPEVHFLCLGSAACPWGHKHPRKH